MPLLLIFALARLLSLYRVAIGPGAVLVSCAVAISVVGLARVIVLNIVYIQYGAHETPVEGGLAKPGCRDVRQGAVPVIYYRYSSRVF